MDDAQRHLNKILDLSEDRRKTTKCLIRLFSELEVDAESLFDHNENICENHNELKDFSMMETCYSCGEKGCRKCGDLFRVDNKHLCYKCYEPKCVDMDSVSRHD